MSVNILKGIMSTSQDEHKSHRDTQKKHLEHSVCPPPFLQTPFSPLFPFLFLLLALGLTWFYPHFPVVDLGAPTQPPTPTYLPLQLWVWRKLGYYNSVQQWVLSRHIMGVHILKRPNPDDGIREILLKEVTSELRIEGRGGVGRERGRAAMYGLQGKEKSMHKDSKVTTTVLDLTEHKEWENSDKRRGLAHPRTCGPCWVIGFYPKNSCIHGLKGQRGDLIYFTNENTPSSCILEERLDEQDGCQRDNF